MGLQCGRDPAEFFKKIGDEVSVTIETVTPGANEYEVDVAPESFPGIPMYLTDYKIEDVDGSIIKRGDRKAFLAASDAPANFSADSKVSFDGLTYEIGAFSPKRVGGSIIYYRLQLTGAG